LYDAGNTPYIKEAAMICERCGRTVREGETHQCAVDPQNDNPAPQTPPFDEKEWRKAYMREYMRRLREQKRGAK
jgi:hypothetical protein